MADNKRGTRAKITPGGRALILARALEWRAKPRREVALLLTEELRAAKQDVPEVEVLERMISWFRNHATGPQEEPWGVESLEDYPQLFPPEALPAILQAWICAREALNHALTVREAKWVARLYAAAEHVGRLTGWAVGHALREVMAEIAGAKAKAPPWEILRLYEEMTGEKFPEEREHQLLEGYKDEKEEWPFSADRATLESWAKKEGAP